MMYIRDVSAARACVFTLAHAYNRDWTRMQGKCTQPGRQNLSDQLFSPRQTTALIDGGRWAITEGEYAV